MAITDERIREILNGRDVSALLELISQLQEPDQEQPRTVIGALSQLEALYYPHLPKLVIKLCVEAPEDTADDVRIFFLASWLKHDGYHYRSEMIGYIIESLQSTSGEQLIAAIRTAWTIGYRDDLLQRELARIAGLQNDPHPDGDAQGYALAALANMAYPDFEAIVRILQSRLKGNGHFTEPDCWAARHVAPPSLIPALCDAARSDSAHLSNAAVYALLDLVARHPEASYEVWKAFESFDEKTRFFYVKTATRWIDLAEAGNYVMREALMAFQHYEQRNLLPPTNQLLAANLPGHIRIFREANNSLRFQEREWLKTLAISSTGECEGYQTVETLNKEAAWDTILRLGLKEARKWLPEAMKDEKNFVLSHLGEIAGFLQVPEAVKLLASAVQDETLGLGIGVACLRHLGVLGTAEAMEAILESRVRIQHGEKRDIPRALVKGLVSVCMTLHTCEVLWDVLRNEDADNQIREACAYAIKDLSTLIGAPLPSAHDLISLLHAEGEGLPGYNQLVFALSRYSDDITTLNFLRELGESSHKASELTQVLAICGLLNEFPRRIEDLGLKRKENEWVVADRIDDTAAFALLFLYRADPSFEPAVLQVLDTQFFHPAIQIVEHLKSTDRISANLRQALWNYALRQNGPGQSDRAALEAVARTWPEMLTEDSTLQQVSQWNDSARRAYLAALWKIDRHYTNRVAGVACLFLSDGEQSVRRDAARLARDRDSGVLRQAVDQLAAKHEQLDSAIFMLDAASWLEDDWNLYESLGRSHREPLVRKLTHKLAQERREGILANNYLPIILQSHDYLETWCYGQALLELGSEETIEKVYAGLPSEVYRRAYLIWLAKELEKRLEKRRQDQSSKIELPPPVSYEEQVEVYVELEDKRLGPFAGILQVSQARRPRRWLWSWSVRIEGTPDLAQHLNATFTDKPINIETTDNRRGKVIPVRTDTHTEKGQTVTPVVLLGQGELEES